MPDAQETPDLHASVDRLTASVDGLRRSVDEDRRAINRKYTTAKKAVRWAMGALTVAVAVALLLAVTARAQNDRIQREITAREDDRLRQEAEDLRSAQVTCDNGNVTRAAIEARFQSFLAALVAVGKAPATPEEATQRQNAIDAFKAKFADDPAAKALGPRDCSATAAKSPVPLSVPPTTAG